MKYIPRDTLCFILVFLFLGIPAFAGKPGPSSGAKPAPVPAAKAAPVLGTKSGPQPYDLHEPVEWSVMRCTGATKSDKPRVLLLGDSIVQGYYPLVEKAMEGSAYCSQLTISYSICDPVYFQELEILLKQYHFNVILFNHGLHGFAYTEDLFAQGFDNLLHVLRADGGGAKLIWATITPVKSGNLDDKEQVRVIKRNKITADRVRHENIPMVDLYAMCISKPELYSPDGLHFAQAGKELQAKAVIEAIQKELESSLETGAAPSDSGAAKPLQRGPGPERRQLLKN